MTNQNYLSIYAKSFNWAGFFLPKQTYQKCSALYDFCRVSDNIADDNDTIESKKNKFKNFESNFYNKNFDDPIIKNMWGLVNEFNISLKIINDLFEGIKSDIKEKVKLNSKKELLIYSYRVAGTVGLMMSRILNVNDRRALKGAIDLGIAMQLTNIARDVVEDKKMNREYIKPDFENIKATLKLAEMFYESSFSSIQKIPFRYKFTIIVARRIYRQIGRKILQKNNMENYEKSGKIFVNNFEKTYQTIISIFDLILVYLKEIEPHQRAEEHIIISQEVDLDERI